jgi:[protein-PII] uridylyltransferase
VKAPEEDLEDIRRFFQKGREWLQKSHAAGLPGAEFCQNYSTLMDGVLRRLLALEEKASGGREKADRGFSLLATGGYGREELSPCSDIDLLILHAPGQGKDLGERLRAILHPLWDWGLTVGYTVQTPKDSLRAAQRDLEILFCFLDARWVGGEKEIHYRWQEEFNRTLLRAKDNELILQIRQRTEARYRKVGDSVFVLEPEIKEGRGGLRDYHSAFWAAKIRYRLRSAEELTEKGLFSEKEWHGYSLALSFLWRVRHQLHFFHRRREDRLSFEDQEAMAEALGYRGENSLQATEAFLKDYFRQALQIHHLSWNLLEKCLNGGPEPRWLWGRKPPAEVAPGFALFRGRLALTEASHFDRNPFYLWKAFLLAHQYGVGMDVRLREVIAEHLDLVTERFQGAEESLSSFLSLLENPGDLSRVLEIMHETGFLRRFLPEFDLVHCHIQYDRYHLYPVDVHSIHCVRELEWLEKKARKKSGALLEELMEEVKDKAVLKLAALVHDLGKAEGGSHAQRGEKIAAEIGERLKLGADRIATLCFLVREHLIFSETAQRRDLNDENLIFRFAQAMGSSERLKMLYLLAFADLRAVGPSAWTAWKDTLMRELFIKTHHLLEKGKGLGKEDQDRIITFQREVMDLLKGQIPTPKISEYLADIPIRHYEVHDSQAIGQQILMAEKLMDQKVVMEGEEKIEEDWHEITVVSRDEPGLFAKICGVLTANFLNILSAQISTWENGMAVDRFYVQNLIDEEILQPRRWSKIQENMRQVLEGRREVSSLVEGMAVPLFHKYSSSRSSTRVVVDNTISDFYTVIEIYTHDRPGLLYRISQKIFEMGLNIWMARISTKVDQVVDVFYIQDLSGAKIEEEEKISRVKREITEELERTWNNAAGKISIKKPDQMTSY